jgi:hypothetical protein
MPESRNGVKKQVESSFTKLMVRIVKCQVLLLIGAWVSMQICKTRYASSSSRKVEICPREPLEVAEKTLMFSLTNSDKRRYRPGNIVAIDQFRDPSCHTKGKLVVSR